MKALPSLLAFAALLPTAQAATQDLLQPQWRAAWLTTTEEAPPLKIEFQKETPGMTISRPGGLFNPAILAAHFAAKGPIPVGDPAPPQVTLANIGDTVGIRVVLSYNQQACQGLTGNNLRLGLANSRGTRQTRNLPVLESAAFTDDIAWCLHFGQGKVHHALFHRPSNPAPELKSNVPTSMTASKRVKTWPNPPPVGLIKPGIPFEAVLSLTRTGPEELKLYGFLAGQEVEHSVAKVSDFTFDTLYLHYPNGSSAPGAAITIREFQLMTPGN